MPRITSFRDLLVWQKSMELAERSYRVSMTFPALHKWGLGQEIRRSSLSVPSNIAEGFGRHYTADYIHHLRYANGSNNELQTQVELGQRVRIVSEEDAVVMINAAAEIGRMLHALVRSLQSRK